MTEFDEILSKALEAARYCYPRLSTEVYVFPKPTNSKEEPTEPAASLFRAKCCRVAMAWLEKLSTSGEFDRAAITIGQLRCQIFLNDRILIPREIVLAIAIYKCVEIFVGAHDVWLGKLWDDPIPF